MNGPVRPALPLPGPLDEGPDLAVCAVAGGSLGALKAAREMLTNALADVEIGRYDRLIVGWASDMLDAASIATLASLLRRTWEAGAGAGRREVVDETAVGARLAEVEAERDRLLAEVATLRTSMGAIEAAVRTFYGRVGDPVEATTSLLDALGAALAGGMP